MMSPPRIGSYEVLAKLASGGMGVVYLAKRRGVGDFQRLVAVKKLHSHIARDPVFVTMFKEEARLAARVHHPNVVSIVEIGETSDGYFVVMDYIEGSNAAHLQFHTIRQLHQFPRSVAIRIVLDALAGLHAAHETETEDGRPLDIVHRDVSPQNLMVGLDGLSRLTDFGIARSSGPREKTLTGEIKGKLFYMAPEQLGNLSLDRRTDLFAMGTVLWELLTGQRLFEAATQIDTINRIAFEPIPSPRRVDDSITRALSDVCMKALERDRSKRFQTAAQFADALEQAARGDAGIATQREVAKLIETVLGETLRRVRETTRRLALGQVEGSTPDLGLDLRGNPGTEQLPQSEAWGSGVHKGEKTPTPSQLAPTHVGLTSPSAVRPSGVTTAIESAPTEAVPTVEVPTQAAPTADEEEATETASAAGVATETQVSPPTLDAQAPSTQVAATVATPTQPPRRVAGIRATMKSAGGPQSQSSPPTVNSPTAELRALEPPFVPSDLTMVDSRILRPPRKAAPVVVGLVVGLVALIAIFSFVPRSPFQSTSAIRSEANDPAIAPPSSTTSAPPPAAPSMVPEVVPSIETSPVATATASAAAAPTGAASTAKRPAPPHRTTPSASPSPSGSGGRNSEFGGRF